MKIEKQVDYYNKLWSERKQLNSLKLRRALKILEYFTIIKVKNKKLKVLDLGCGDGRFSAFIGEFSETDAIDLSEESMRIAKIKHEHVNYFSGSALDYEFEKEYYDVVISQEVIEHIENQIKYVEVCHSVLKKGGFLILTTPNKNVFEHMEGGNWSNQPIENILYKTQLNSLISKSFKIIDYSSVIMNFGSMGYFGIVNHRLLIGGFNFFKLRKLREYFLSKMGFGLHHCILAIKK